ncbi:site-specific integrase [Streptomyces sp. NPDC056708]|uniref:site-specific integrase n=1 Tax=unclassified Streptomyces TaxID=2593676 RepID=UPI00367F9FC9
MVDGDGQPVAAACRFLDHLVDRGFSPHTICAYAYDLRRLFTFVAAEGMDWREFRGPDALRLLAFLRQAPSRRPAQRLGDTGQPARTVNRILAAVSSFYDWAVVAEEYDGDSPMQKRLDPALARVPDRHQPFMGRASRQQPTRRTVTVKQPRRLPRPVDEVVLEKFIGSLKRLRARTATASLNADARRPGPGARGPGPARGNRHPAPRRPRHAPGRRCGRAVTGPDRRANGRAATTSYRRIQPGLPEDSWFGQPVRRERASQPRVTAIRPTSMAT